MTTGMPELGDLQQMTNRLRKFSEDTQRRAAQFQQVSERLAEASVSEQAEGGAITVTVSSSGALTGMELTDRARELPAARLSAAILGCVQRAQAKIADTAQQIVAETVQDDSPEAGRIADTIVATFRNNFPPPAEPTTSTPPENGPDVGGLAEQDERDRPGPADEREHREDEGGNGSFLQ